MVGTWVVDENEDYVLDLTEYYVYAGDSIPPWDIEIYESISTTEYTDIYVEILFSVYDDVATTEVINLYLTILYCSLYDEISVNEWASIYLNVLNIIAYEDISIEEFISLYLDVLNAIAYDVISVIDNVLTSIDILIVNLVDTVSVIDSVLAISVFYWDLIPFVIVIRPRKRFYSVLDRVRIKEILPRKRLYTSYKPCSYRGKNNDRRRNFQNV